MAICPLRGKCEVVTGAQAVIRIGSTAKEIDTRTETGISPVVWKVGEVTNDRSNVEALWRPLCRCWLGSQKNHGRERTHPA